MEEGGSQHKSVMGSEARRSLLEPVGIYVHPHGGAQQATNLNWNIKGQSNRDV